MVGRVEGCHMKQFVSCSEILDGGSEEEEIVLLNLDLVKKILYHSDEGYIDQVQDVYGSYYNCRRHSDFGEDFRDFKSCIVTFGEVE